jgi:predicted nucleic acid-binding protein
MKAFLDTSSLLKLYHHEEGTEALNIALSQNLEAIYLSELARLEFRSAIWKKIELVKLILIWLIPLLVVFNKIISNINGFILK